MCEWVGQGGDTSHSTPSPTLGQLAVAATVNVVGVGPVAAGVPVVVAVAVGAHVVVVCRIGVTVANRIQ